MASRDDEDRERHSPSRWRGPAAGAPQSGPAPAGRHDTGYLAGDAGSARFSGPHTAGPHTGDWDSGPRAREAATLPGAEGPASTPAGAAYGSGRWGGYGQEPPGAYGSPSGTGYGQTCQGQSGYGQAESSPSGPQAGVSYAGTTGYAGYAGARHGAEPEPAEAQRPRPDWYDLDYQQWRDEQVRKLDHDYQTWRQARYRRFAEEFNAWRSSRQDAAGSASALPSPPAQAPPAPAAHDAPLQEPQASPGRGGGPPAATPSPFPISQPQ